MTKRLLIVCAVFFAIVIGYDLVATAARALTSGSAFSFMALATPPLVNQARGSLTSVNLNVLFAKNGDGDEYITQGYGNTPYSYMYIDHWHNGIDLAANYGAPVYSPTTATVLATGDQDNYCPHIAFGRFIVLQDNTNHLMLLFAHLDRIAVQSGTTVKQGDLIGTIGTSGDETGPHLHFSIFEAAGFSMAPAHGCGPYPQGKDVDPLKYLGTIY